MRASTYDDYELCIRRMRRYIGHYNLTHLRAPTILAMYHQLRTADGLNPGTINKSHAILRRALRVAVQWKYLDSSPILGVRAPKYQRKELTTLSAEQTRFLLTGTQGEPLQPLWMILATTGIRTGEAMGLRWGDIDLTAKTLAIQRTAQFMAHKGVVFLEPKTAQSRRNLALCTEAVDALREHQLRQRDWQLNAGMLWDDQNLVFPIA